jgi:haloalkane dehalogenase
MSAADVVAAHQQAGRRFEAGGVQSFVREEGDGEPVVCLHGVPTSSFLYRKVIAELAKRGLRGVAFDLPGLGLAARPEDFDYTWTGLGRFAVAAVDALGLERFHLVVHDIGGPVGFEVARALPERVLSLTALNTIIDVDEFRRPWQMKPFAAPGLGRLWLAALRPAVMRKLFRGAGIKDQAAMTDDEVVAYNTLLKREDGGRAFLRVMRGFELTREKRDLYHAAVRHVPYPVQVVWGEDDKALKPDDHGLRMARAAAVALQRIQGRHFFQEEQAPAIADRIAGLARSASR